MQLGVLLVELDEDLRYWMGRLLDRSEGFILRESCSEVFDLAEIVKRVSPDLILLDSKAVASLNPDEIARVKSRPSAPYLVLTGIADEKSQKKTALSAGADEYFDKSRALQSLDIIRNNILNRYVAGNNRTRQG